MPTPRTMLTLVVFGATVANGLISSVATAAPPRAVTRGTTHLAVRVPAQTRTQPQRAPQPGVAEFRDLALRNNPTLVQAHAIVEANEGAAFQAARFRNPSIGYVADQVGVDGTAGEVQGLFVSQEIVTGGKLKLSQQKYLQRAEIARTYAYAQQERVLNSVELAFYRALAEQQVVVIRRRMTANARDELQTTREMLNLGQANHADVLKSEVNAQRIELQLATAERSAVKAWRDLVSVVGVPCMPRSALRGSLLGESLERDWDETVCRLLAESPELIAAREKVYHDELAVQRELVEPIPNIQLGADAGYNYESGNAVAGLTVGIELPVFNRNRGTVTQASADLRQAKAEVKRIELELTTRLASQFHRYEISRTRVERFRNVMIPKSREAYDLLLKAYHARRGVWMDVLEAQRMLLEIEEMLIRESLALRESLVLVDGLLLHDGLMRPPLPMDGGHIDATPDPR